MTCYAKMCTALRREHDFGIGGEKEQNRMLPGPYFLQGKTNILMFEENFATSVVVDLCGQGHTKRLQQQRPDSLGHEIPIAKL